MEEFTEEEKKMLAPFVTNLDKPIFVLTNLPEVVKGALFSRYSRSSKSLRRTLVDEFILKPEMGFKEIVGHATEQGAEQRIAIQKAEEFYDRVLLGFGDDSIAELASVHIAIEDISNIATKTIEDRRIGISPLEKSTRYVYFDKQHNGQWLYYRDPNVMESDFAKLYEQTCDKLFETYAKLIPKISNWVIERNPQGEESDRAYKSTVRAKTCDILRGLLPAATRTNMGAMGNGRAFEYLLNRLYSNELQEMQHIAKDMQNELAKVIPSFVKRATGEFGIAQQNYWKDIDKDMAELVKNYPCSQSDKEVEMLDYDKDAEHKAVAYILYSYTHMPLSKAYEKAKQMPVNEKEKLIATYIGKRDNRRHKPGRAFENIYYHFDVLTNFGAYRDLHRHRILTQERQLLSCNHGYALPQEIVEAGYEKEFKNAMEMAKQTYETMAAKMPKQAQYVVPLAYNLRWYFTLNLREAFYLCELRSTPQGHRDYRKIAHRIYEEISRVHPMFAKYMNFVDLKQYNMERLKAEKEIDQRIKEIEKKYGDKKS